MVDAMWLPVLVTVGCAVGVWLTWGNDDGRDFATLEDGQAREIRALRWVIVALVAWLAYLVTR